MLVRLLVLVSVLTVSSVSVCYVERASLLPYLLVTGESSLVVSGSPSSVATVTLLSYLGSLVLRDRPFM